MPRLNLAVITRDKFPLSPLPFPPNTTPREPPGCLKFLLHRRRLRRGSRPISAAPHRPLPPRPSSHPPQALAHLPASPARSRVPHSAGNDLNRQHCRLQTTPVSHIA